MLLETKKDGTRVYGTDYSGRCTILQSSNRKWYVYAEEDYEDVCQEYEEWAISRGTLLENNDAKDLRAMWNRELDAICKGVFRTRKAAREYVEKTGGTWE